MSHVNLPSMDVARWPESASLIQGYQSMIATKYMNPLAIGM